MFSTNNIFLFLMVLLGTVAFNTRGSNGFLNTLSYKRDSRNTFKLQKLECNDNDQVLRVTCLYGPAPNLTGYFSFLFEYQRLVTDAYTEIRIYSKPPSAKSFKLTPFRQKLNFCMLTTKTSSVPNLFTIFLPQSFEAMFKPCPYSGSYIANFTLPLVPIDTNFFPVGEYRLDITFTGDESVFLWRLRAFAVAQIN